MSGNESRRSQRLPKGWRKKRARILRRDGYRCRWQDPEVCIGHATEVDHTTPAIEGGSNRDENLAAICEPCHRRKTAREARRQQPSRRRPDEDHPGAL